ncbi:hypothetical protein [Rhodopseudomonas pseudopalustris]|uniref:hypothetical protein n=1 Tax=Rhodopseudomonas pseudopalustris TaxID=1513892 RepID=UPI001588029D|nr:hypothetical protein [Rhodopseudomonas pseudopalustris]
MSKTFCFGGDEHRAAPRDHFCASDGQVRASGDRFLGRVSSPSHCRAGFDVETVRSFGRNRHSHYIVARTGAWRQ